MLRQLVASLQQQLDDSNRKVDALLQEVAELKHLLVRKTEEEQKQRNNYSLLRLMIIAISTEGFPYVEESSTCHHNWLLSCEVITFHQF